jgi:hypothetical protein
MRRLGAAYEANVYNGAPFEFIGTEDGGHALSAKAINTIRGCMCWVDYPRVDIRGVIFKSHRARTTVHNNRGCMMPWTDQQDRHRTAYGEIRNIFDVNSPALAAHGLIRLPPVVEVIWMERLTPSRAHFILIPFNFR